MLDSLEWSFTVFWAGALRPLWAFLGTISTDNFLPSWNPWGLDVCCSPAHSLRTSPRGRYWRNRSQRPLCCLISCSRMFCFIGSRSSLILTIRRSLNLWRRKYWSSCVQSGEAAKTCARIFMRLQGRGSLGHRMSTMRGGHVTIERGTCSHLRQEGVATLSSQLFRYCLVNTGGGLGC